MFVLSAPLSLYFSHSFCDEWCHCQACLYLLVPSCNFSNFWWAISQTAEAPSTNTSKIRVIPTGCSGWRWVSGLGRCLIGLMQMEIHIQDTSGCGNVGGVKNRLSFKITSWQPTNNSWVPDLHRCHTFPFDNQPLWTCTLEFIVASWRFWIKVKISNPDPRLVGYSGPRILVSRQPAEFQPGKWSRLGVLTPGYYNVIL